METNTAIKLAHPQEPTFRDYLERSLRDPFTLNLKGMTLMEVIRACVKAKRKQHPRYGNNIACLTYNIEELQKLYRVVLEPVQVTDIFWGYFIDFCAERGLKGTTVSTLCQQLRSILNWAVKYNATVSPTYTDFKMPKGSTNEIALTADDVSRITYFDVEAGFEGRRTDYRETMRRVRDMFVLSCNLFQRHSDMVRIGPECFERNIFRITQQKTGNQAVVNIDLYSIEPKTTYRILEQYGYQAPYKADIGNYNGHLHELMKAVGLTEVVRVETRGQGGQLRVETVPKWKLISSHTARRTAITVNVLRGKNIHALKRCSGHTDLRIFDNYVRDE